MATIILRDSGSISSPGATAKGAPLTNLEVDNNFSNINLTVGVVGDLTTTAKSNLVIAVNELVTSNTATNTRITTTNSNLSTVDSNVGVLSNLTTTSKANLVNALNEVKAAAALTSANVSQFAVGTSADLFAVISDETGTGNLVFSTSPTLVTPTIGAASGSSLNLSGNLTSKNFFSETAELTSYGSVRALMESANVTATAPVANVNIDLSTRAIQYWTSNAANNFTLNFRANSSVSLNTMMTTGNTITTAVMVTNGSPAYYPSAVQIDGTGQTIKWQNGSAVSAGNTSALDIYTFTILKTGSATYTVLGTQTKFA